MRDMLKTIDELEDVLARIRIRNFILIAVALIFGFLIGHYLVPLHRPGDYSYLSADELQDGIDVYRLCMRSASQTGCEMSIDNYTVFKDLKSEQARREQERARLEVAAALEAEQ